MPGFGADVYLSAPAKLVDMLSEVGEVEFAHLFVDGTKIEANANKHSFVWKENKNKYKARLDA